MWTTCQTIGRPPISTSGLGIERVPRWRRVPRPPQRIATVGRLDPPGSLIAGGIIARIASPAVKRLPTRLDGPVLIEPTTFADSRGFFQETYRRSVYAELGVDVEFVQDNHSRSTRGVVRGMHFQIGAGQAKLVRCARGAIVDVVVDIRAGSPTYGQWEAFQLDEENLRMAYVPVGFAHGFCVV